MMTDLKGYNQMCSQAAETKARRRSQMLRERLAAKQRASTSGDGRLTLSPLQSSVWMYEQVVSNTATYTTLRCWRISGDLNVKALHSALQMVVDRQVVLRMRVEGANGQPNVVFTPALKVDLEVETLRRAELASRLHEISHTPINLATGPVFAFHLLKLCTGDYVFCAVIHHIAVDDWSYGIFADELGTLYRAVLNGNSPPAVPTYSLEDHMMRAPRSQDAPRSVRHRMNWPQGNAGIEQQSTDPRGRVVRVHFPREMTARLRQVAKTERVTLFALLTAGYQFLLAQYCGQNEVTVGVSYATRPIPELEKLIGMFVDFDSLDVTLKYDQTLISMARAAQSRLLAMQDGRTHSVTSGIEASVSYYNTPDQSLHLEGALTRPERLPSMPLSLPLHLAIRNDNGGLELGFIARETLFSEVEIEVMADTYKRILTQFAKTPNLSLADVELVGEVEKRRLADISTSEAEYPRQNDIPTQFEAMVELYPDKVALTTPLGSWTYRALDSLADRMAHWLRERGVSNGTVVGVCLPRGVGMIVATLGVMKAGAIVAPIDPEYPDVRLHQMIEMSECKTVLCADDATTERFPVGLACTTPHIDDLVCSDVNFKRERTPMRPAYLVFTSGSTGRPKAVITPHRGVVRLAAGLFDGGIGPDDRIAQLASPSFDGAFIEIWGGLLNGAMLVSPEGDIKSLRDIVAFLRDNRITVGFFTTGLYNVIIDEDPATFKTFRGLSVGGEALSPLHINKARVAFPQARIFNVYGPTENSALSTSFEITETVEHRVPIGRAVPNSMAFVLSDTLSPLPSGFAGELYVGGAGLALGYKNLPEETATKFIEVSGAKIGLPTQDIIRLYRTGDQVRWSFGGQIEYLGRMDAQVKLNGYRIELGEIERALETHPDVNGAIVIAQTGRDEGRVSGLVAFYESTNDGLGGDHIHEYLQGLLPRFCMPTMYRHVQTFPLTFSGKVDRKALLAVETLTNSTSPQDLNIDLRLVEIWADLLECEITSANADFFILGGNSLLAMRMLAQVERVFDCTLDVVKFLREPYLDKLLAQTHLQPRALAGRNKRVALLRDGDPALEPVICVFGLSGSYMWARELIHAWPKGRPVYGISLRRSRGAETFDQLADDVVDDLKQVFGECKVHLAGYSFAGFLAFVIAEKLGQAGMQVGRVVLLDSGTNLIRIASKTYNKKPQATTDMLKWLLGRHNLLPVDIQLDLITCQRSFPWPLQVAGDAWAIFANKGVRVHEFDTYHSNILYGEWAIKSAEMIESIVIGKADPAETVNVPRWDDTHLDLLHRARSSTDVGDALTYAENLADALQTTPAWLFAILAECYAQTEGRQGLRKLMRRMKDAEGVSPEAWGAVAKVAEDMQFTQITADCLRSAAGNLTERFQLALAQITLGNLGGAEGLADTMIHSNQRVADGHLVRAIIAMERGDKGRALGCARLALAGRNVSVGQVLFAVHRIFAVYHTGLARAVVIDSLQDFPNHLQLVSALERLESKQAE